MYLFSRRARLANGHLRDSTAWAVGVTEKVNQITELDVSLWTTVFSPGLGELVWATFVTDLAVLEAAEAKLMVDDEYVALVDKGAAFSTADGADDTLSQLLHGEVDPTRQIQYVAVIETTVAAGKTIRGMELGVEIAQRATKVTGIPTAFLADTTGNYGGVRWITGYDTIAQLQSAGETIASNTGFGQFVDKEAASVYLAGPSVTTQRIARRVV
jgi:hypothetical protein